MVYNVQIKLIIKHHHHNLTKLKEDESKHKLSNILVTHLLPIAIFFVLRNRIHDIDRLLFEGFLVGMTRRKFPRTLSPCLVILHLRKACILPTPMIYTNFVASVTTPQHNPYDAAIITHILTCYKNDVCDSQETGHNKSCIIQSKRRVEAT